MRRTGGEVVIANVNSVKLNIIYLYILSIACFSPVFFYLALVTYTNGGFFSVHC